MRVISDKKKRRIFVIVTLVFLLIAVMVSACAVYLFDYYRADMAAIEVFAPENTVEMQTLKDGTIVFAPKDATKGFIFYPGGKVEYTAYVPLMRCLASKGILCVLVEMPFNLAVLDVNAADGIQKQYPNIDSWYIGGHSLGGSMAAAYLTEHADEYEGLVLLGAYSTADLSETDLDVLSVYGSEDKVMNGEKYDENKSCLPGGFAEIVIEGGCHAGFGMYGHQDGDGTPTITGEEQIKLTADYVCEFME